MIFLQTFSSGLKLGLFFLSIGVGTVAIKILQSLISDKLLVICKFFNAFFSSEAVTSSVSSIPFFKSLTRLFEISKPLISNWDERFTAKEAEIT